MSARRSAPRRRCRYFGAFQETNVRLYSIDDAGRHGVLFRSLETARLAVVPVVRAALGIPYTWARMGIIRDDDRIRMTASADGRSVVCAAG